MYGAIGVPVLEQIPAWAASLLPSATAPKQVAGTSVLIFRLRWALTHHRTPGTGLATSLLCTCLSARCQPLWAITFVPIPVGGHHEPTDRLPFRSSDPSALRCRLPRCNPEPICSVA